MNNSEPAASIMLQIGKLTIGNTFVTTLGVMQMFLQPCSLPIPHLTLTGRTRPSPESGRSTGYQVMSKVAGMASLAKRERKNSMKGYKTTVTRPTI
ncbi:MAG: hypothetical protein PHO08_20840 [Methylococcales bacterium]|nr:hypothetical protein [Methylococcales bacterium]MDD5633179.1 hypothetical protein [Methylococcales bacterium]